MLNYIYITITTAPTLSQQPTPQQPTNLNVIEFDIRVHFENDYILMTTKMWFISHRFSTI